MPEDAIRVAAIDLGASSGRVVVGHGTVRGFALREVHRFANQPRRIGGVLRWDARALFAGILNGLRAAGREGARLDAVAVDGWGVDYGLLDGDGALIADPANYRDPRTGPSYAAVIETAGGVGGVDGARLYRATGIAAHPFNTVFQLMADGGSAELRAARHALLVPDLMTYWLSGQLGTELTNASTTGLLDPRTMTWAAPVADALGVPTGLFPRFRTAGELACWPRASPSVSAWPALRRSSSARRTTPRPRWPECLPPARRSPSSAPAPGRWPASSSPRRSSPPRVVRQISRTKWASTAPSGSCAM